MATTCCSTLRPERRTQTANYKEEEIEKYKWKRGHLNHYRKIHRKPLRGGHTVFMLL